MKRNAITIRIVLIAGAVAFRMLLKWRFMEPSGFYNSLEVPLLFQIYVAGACLYFLYDGMRKTQKVSYTKRFFGSQGTLLVFCGGAVLLQSLLKAVRFWRMSTGIQQILEGMEVLLGIGAAAVFLLVGLNCLRREDGRALGGWAALPALWALGRLIGLFLTHPQINGLSSLTLEFLSWVMFSIFLLGGGRIWGGAAADRGARQLLAYGWTGCCLGLTCAVPNILLGDWHVSLPQSVTVLLLALLGGVSALSFQEAETPPRQDQS